jgi:hypothetical protein
VDSSCSNGALLDRNPTAPFPHSLGQSQSIGGAADHEHPCPELGQGLHQVDAVAEGAQVQVEQDHAGTVGAHLLQQYRWG